MDEPKWINQRLTDSEVSEKLNGLPQDKTFKQVDLRYNYLENSPHLSLYKQFDCLEKLSLSNNKIVSVDTEKFPRHIKVLRLNDNKIIELGDLSHCHRLEELKLENNKMESIDPFKLPLNIKILNVKNNELKEVKDFSQFQQLGTLTLSNNKITDINPSNIPLDIKWLNMNSNQLRQVRDFSGHKHLVKLSVSGNEVTDIDPAKIPTNIQELDLADNQLTEVGDFSCHQCLVNLNLRGNQIIKIYDVKSDKTSWNIDTFDEFFFEDESNYHELMKCNFNTECLIQPPQTVLESGLESVQTYFKDMALFNRVQHSRKSPDETAFGHISSEEETGTGKPCCYRCAVL